MNITLSYADLAAIVKRSLSIIGKRSVDANGNLLFKDITLSSIEEPILNDFFSDAAIQLKTKTEHFLTTVNGNTLTLTLPSNRTSGTDTALEEALKAYCVSYALYSWFTITAPRIATKYQEDAERHLAAIITLVYTKNPPM